MKHALFNASAAPVWTVCPNSALLSKLAGPDEPGTAAKRGIKLHKIADDWFKAYMRDVEYEPPIIDGISDVRFYVEYLISEEQAGSCPRTEEYVGDPYYLYGGTADALMYKEVADFKTGDVPVQAEGNLQLEALAFFAGIQNARISIIQKSHISTAMCKESGQIFTDAIAAAATGEAPYKKGPQCNRCKGKKLCPEWGNKTAPAGSSSNGF